MRITDKIFYGVVAAACLYYVIGVIAVGIAILRDYQECKEKERVMKNESAIIQTTPRGLPRLVAILTAQHEQERNNPRPTSKAPQAK